MMPRPRVACTPLRLNRATGRYEPEAPPPPPPPRPAAETTPPESIAYLRRVLATETGPGSAPRPAPKTRTRQDRVRTPAGRPDDGSTVPTPGDAPDGDSDGETGFPASARPPPGRPGTRSPTLKKPSKNGSWKMRAESAKTG